MIKISISWLSCFTGVKIIPTQGALPLVLVTNGLQMRIKIYCVDSPVSARSKIVFDVSLNVNDVDFVIILVLRTMIYFAVPEFRFWIAIFFIIMNFVTEQFINHQD